MALASCEALAYKGLREWGKAYYNKPETLLFFTSSLFSFSMATPVSSLEHDVYEKVKIKSGLKVKYFKLQVIDSQNGDKDLTEYQIKTMLFMICKNLTRRKAYNGHFLI